MPVVDASLRRQADRIAILGPAGSGKTTVATRLAASTGLPHIELDELVHGPGWSVRRPDLPVIVARTRRQIRELDARLSPSPEGLG